MHTQAYQNLFQRIYNWAESLPVNASFKDINAITCALATSGGSVRLSNEDQMVVVKANFVSPAQSSFILYAVLDGMGGMKEGAECARLALSAFVSELVLSTQSVLELKVSSAIEKANLTVFEKFKGNGGTTLAGVIINQLNEAVILNVGDSRVYEVSIENKHVKQVSIDDTLGGALASWGSKQFENSNQLIQFIGMGKGLIEPHLMPRSGIEGKGYIIATDGAFKMPEGMFESILSHASSPKEIVHRLIRVSEWIGGLDNASVICVWPENLNFLKENKTVSAIRLYGTQDTLEIQGHMSTQVREAVKINPALAEVEGGEDLEPQLFKDENLLRSAKTSTKKKKTAKRKSSKRLNSQVEIKLLDD
ncbi:MAG TPA: hypothetical protein VHP58_02645 [Alphaproteobacteria bacterium]|nr:hypothetical protein [Alphaproteobacteria bacterium]